MCNLLIPLVNDSFLIYVAQPPIEFRIIPTTTTTTTTTAAVQYHFLILLYIENNVIADSSLSLFFALALLTATSVMELKWNDIIIMIIVGWNWLSRWLLWL